MHEFTVSNDLFTPENLKLTILAFYDAPSHTRATQDPPYRMAGYSHMSGALEATVGASRRSKGSLSGRPGTLGDVRHAHVGPEHRDWDPRPGRGGAGTMGGGGRSMGCAAPAAAAAAAAAAEAAVGAASAASARAAA